MKEIHFDNNDFSVSYKSEKILLLPKEFKLLEYLFDNVNQTLSRETLLNKVWPLSDPTDRTIDDHVYRLRKKLSLWDQVSIETVRGLGYRLIMKQKEDKYVNVLQYDKEFTETMNRLFQKYVQYGQGTGLKTVLLNHEYLNIPFENRKEIYLHYVQGEFDWFITDSNHSISEKMFYILHIYSLIQFDMDKTQLIFKQILKSKRLPMELQLELEKFGIIGIELNSGNFENALIKINHVKSMIDEKLIDPSLLVYVMNQELKLNLYRKDSIQFRKNSQHAEMLFEKYPFLREKGTFYILKGLNELYMNNSKEGILSIDKGLEVLSNSKYIPNEMAGVKDTLVIGNYLDIKIPEKYKKKWLYFSTKYNFPFLTVSLEKIINQHL